MTKMSDAPNPRIPIYNLPADGARRDGPTRPRAPLGGEERCTVCDDQGLRCIWAHGHTCDDSVGHQYMAGGSS